MAALDGLGMKGCEEMYRELREVYFKESSKINEIVARSIVINGKEERHWELKVAALAMMDPEKMDFDERVKKIVYLIEVVKRINKLEARAFKLLNRLFAGSEKLADELKVCLNRQDREIIGIWGNKLLDDQEKVERFIDRLDDQIIHIQKAIDVFGVDVFLDRQPAYERWWRRELADKDLLKKMKSVSGKELDASRKEIRLKTSRSIDSLKDLEQLPSRVFPKRI